MGCAVSVDGVVEFDIVTEKKTELQEVSKSWFEIVAGRYIPFHLRWRFYQLSTPPLTRVGRDILIYLLFIYLPCIIPYTIYP